MVAPQVESLEVGQVADLDGQVRDLVAGRVELHQRAHAADFLGQADQSVVVHHEDLEIGQRADRRRQIAQLVPAAKRKKIFIFSHVRATTKAGLKQKADYRLSGFNVT